MSFLESCRWTIGGGNASGTPRAGRYYFHLSASKTDGETVNSTATVLVAGTAGLRVGVHPLQELQQNPVKKLALLGWVEAVAAADVTYQWSVDPPLSLASRNVSTTGDSQQNLVLLPQALTAGATYTFTLYAASRLSQHSAVWA